MAYFDLEVFILLGNFNEESTWYFVIGAHWWAEKIYKNIFNFEMKLIKARVDETTRMLYSFWAFSIMSLRPPTKTWPINTGLFCVCFKGTSTKSKHFCSPEITRCHIPVRSCTIRKSAFPIKTINLHDDHLNIIINNNIHLEHNYQQIWWYNYDGTKNWLQKRHISKHIGYAYNLTSDSTSSWTARNSMDLVSRYSTTNGSYFGTSLASILICLCHHTITTSDSSPTTWSKEELNTQSKRFPAKQTFYTSSRYAKKFASITSKIMVLLFAIRPF